VRHLYIRVRERGAAASGELPEEPDGDAVRERANLPPLSAQAAQYFSLSPCAYRQHSLAYVRAQIDRTVTPSSAVALSPQQLAPEKWRRAGDRAYKCLSASRLTIKYMGKK
jgi:hypothetical protein